MVYMAIDASSYIIVLNMAQSRVLLAAEDTTKATKPNMAQAPFGSSVLLKYSRNTL
jgi:hypothetical protein